MANICDYKMMVRGSKKNIEILKALMSEDMDKAKKLGYNGKRLPFDMFFESDILVSVCGETNDEQLICCQGSARWSCESSFFIGEDENEISYEVLSEQLGLESEIWSTETGNEIAEHIIVAGAAWHCDNYEYREEYDIKNCDFTVVEKPDNFDFFEIEENFQKAIEED